MNKKIYVAGGLVGILLLMGVGCSDIKTTKTTSVEKTTQTVTKKDIVSTTKPILAEQDVQPAVKPKVEKKTILVKPVSQPKPAIKPESKSAPKVEQSEQVATKLECKIYLNELNTCTKSKCKFEHPLTGDILEREIFGIINGKCKYVEQMPNGGKMECNYTDSKRKVAARYYKDSDGAESTETNLKANLETGESTITYKIDGKIVDNPMVTFMSDGTCVISGY